MNKFLSVLGLARLACSAIAAYLVVGAALVQAATITITPVPTFGKVTSSVGGINCGSGFLSCTSSNITTGTSVTLTATANAGATFVSYTVTGLGTTSTNPLTFPMPASAVTGSVNFNAAPVFTSATATTFTTLVAGSFAVTATGSPAPTFAVTSGSLPASVTLASNGTLSGTPATGTAGSYPVTITASNGVLPNATQAFTLSVIASLPGAPTGVSAVAGSRQATVSFSPPASNGGAAITSYTATSTPGGITASGASSPLIVTGLTDLTSYTFKVTATNSVGTGPASAASNSVTPQTAVGAPTNVVAAVSGDRQASVTCDPPAETGDSGILTYTATSSPGGFTDTQTTCNLTVGGLTRGTSYTFTVVAANLQGPGSSSAPSSAVTAITTPGAPTMLGATPGMQMATVFFTAPADDGGSPITTYNVMVNPLGFVTQGPAAPIDVTGLGFGETYTFTVTATNAAGEGPASASSAPVQTPTGAPADPPYDVRAMGGDGKATISFGPGFSSSGAPITSYVVTSTPGGFTGSGPGSPIDVNGLANGTAYTFNVASVNAAGTGTASPESNAVTPHAIGRRVSPYAYVTNALDNNVAVVDTSTNTVITTIPVGVGPTSVGISDDGSRVYVANQTDMSISVIDADTNSVTGTATLTSMPGMIAVAPGGIRAYVTMPLDGAGTVAVVNGLAGVAEGTIPLPGAGGIVVDPADGSIYATDTSGIVRIDPDTQAVSRVILHAASGMLALAANGTLYTTDSSPAVIGVKNGVVTSTAVLPTTAFSLAVNPVNGKVYAALTTNEIAVTSGSTVETTWGGFSDVRGIATSPAGDRLYVVEASANDVAVIDTANGTAASLILVGNSPFSLGQFVGPRVDSVPDAPTNVSAIAGNTTASISFTPPAYGGSSPITGYSVFCDVIMGEIPFPGASSPVVLTGLANDVVHTCTISADNAVGIGIMSDPVIFTPHFVGAAPAFTSAASTSFTVQAAGTFTVTATGSPAPTLARTGALPAGVTFTPASGVLAGTPAAGTAGAYPLTFTASNGVAPDATQNFVLTIAKISQTIAFAPIANQLLSASPLTLSATATSGLAVAFTSSTTGVCTVAGLSLTLVSAGTCSVNADQAGDANHDAAPRVTVSFQVSAGILQYTLQATKSGAGTGAVVSSPAGINCPGTCALALNSGTQVTLTATPTGGSTFAGWSGDCSGTGTCQLTMSDAKSVTATFDPASTSQSADVGIAQSANPSPAGAAKDVIFTLTATNSGPAAATNVSVVNLIPAGASFVWASPGCANAAGQVTCGVGTLASGASVTRKVVLRPAAAGSIANTASVSATNSDPHSTNNVNTLVVTVNATPAGVPIQRYRLYSDVTKEHHFTTDLNEYNVLGTYVGTWVQEGGVGKILNNPGSFGGVAGIAYYRLYDNSTRWHHWTTDANEYYTLGFVYSGWNMEGVDGWILPSNPPGTTQLYRLNYPPLGSLHHWTIDANEYNTLISTYGWIGEPGAGFVVQ